MGLIVNKYVRTHTFPGKDGHINLLTALQNVQTARWNMTRWSSLRNTTHSWPTQVSVDSCMVWHSIYTQTEKWQKPETSNYVLQRRCTCKGMYLLEYEHRFSIWPCLCLLQLPSINIHSWHCKFSMESATCQRRCAWNIVWPYVAEISTASVSHFQEWHIREYSTCQSSNIIVPYRHIFTNELLAIPRNADPTTLKWLSFPSASSNFRLGVWVCGWVPKDMNSVPHTVRP